MGRREGGRERERPTSSSAIKRSRRSAEHVCSNVDCRRGCLGLFGARTLEKKEQCCLGLELRWGGPAGGGTRKTTAEESGRGPGGVETEAFHARFPTALASMGTLSPSSTSIRSCQDACPTYDELSMQQSLLFSDILKDLKNLRSQLYSAAEYFELSFTNDEQKQMYGTPCHLACIFLGSLSPNSHQRTQILELSLCRVVDTLKDYAIKALVNTVDHLGSVSYKVNDLLDEKFDEVSGTELRVYCIEQRLRTCQEFIDLEGLSQQSLVIATPKYHKRNWSMPESGRHAVAHHQEKQLLKEDREPQLFQSGRFFLPLLHRELVPTLLPGRFVPNHLPLVQESLKFQKRAPSPVPTSILNPLLRSGSLSIRSNVPISSNNARRLPTKAQKSASMRLHAERDEQEDVEHNPSKSKRLLKALLSRRKSKKDEMLHTYIDEY
ncbi:hypothetical protein Taro_022489 [Colocasia esculenta]|uniref:Uncharacterized protein n=1 Tax=Colocasia esculenta TaxID=4460 RepID=A0A843V803_COLES|nr:hypothetical protein [Colocasia esculenta]